MVESTLLESGLPCPDCNSSDALAKYSDGHTYCFSCQKHRRPNRQEHEAADMDWFEEALAYVNDSKPSSNLADIGAVRSLSDRKIPSWVCEFYGYTVSNHNGQNCQLANFYVNNELVGQKARFADKRFQIFGKIPGLYGEHRFKEGGKRLVITEGEIDAMSAFLVLAGPSRNHWPVVSIPNGAASAEKSIKQSLQFVNSFQEVVILFDQDEQGQKAALAVAKLLPPGKAHIATLPLKDANDMIKAGREAELRKACWDAKPYRPDGIVNASSLWERVRKSRSVESIPYPFPALNNMTKGLRKRELITITSGTGMGKSTLVREIAHDLLSKGKRVGMMMLEEAPDDTMRSIMGIELSKPLVVDRECATEEEQKAAFDKVSDNLVLYDHFGSLDFELIMNTIRYMAIGNACDFIIFDHVSIAIAAMSEGNERKQIDVLVTKLRTLVQETGVGLIMVSHLSRQEGKPHEEGGRVSLSNLRGSHSTAQISDMVIALERNQQAETGSNIVTVRILKNRFTGETGVSGYLAYDKDIGRLSEHNSGAAPSQSRGASTPGNPTNDEDDY